MQEEELKAYKALKKQGALLLRAPKYRLVVVSTKLTNFTVTLLFHIPVTIREYYNWHCYVPEYYQGPNIREPQTKYYQEDIISDKLSEVIIFRRK